MTKTQDRYTYRVQWDEENGKFAATVAEMPSFSWIASTPEGALRGLRMIVDEAIDDMEERGEALPVPIMERHYSGHFTLRLTPEEHRMLALEAAEQGVSVNKLAESRVLARIGS
ncbi:hypothetical protein KIM372_02270 [Bombiscardovia nodaiensis]|uniref:Antitoxin HicB n=1 Tax=Bombiscardovia nodaiensis TaxID=2932181 RepID=A0ABM8B662_9BIFI|nr:hypothetical protein KIM372_02270 [Bombiscardovia nodaiensis]